jgi:hypothetical protein
MRAPVVPGRRQAADIPLGAGNRSDAGSPANVRVTPVSPTTGLANTLAAAPALGNLSGPGLLGGDQLLGASPLPLWLPGALGYGAPDGGASPSVAGKVAGYTLETGELVDIPAPPANEPDLDGALPATEELPWAPATPANEPAPADESLAASGTVYPTAVDAVMAEFAPFQSLAAGAMGLPTSSGHDAAGAARGWWLLALLCGQAIYPPAPQNDARRINPRRGRIG